MRHRLSQVSLWILILIIIIFGLIMNYIKLSPYVQILAPGSVLVMFGLFLIFLGVLSKEFLKNIITGSGIALVGFAFYLLYLISAGLIIINYAETFLTSLFTAGAMLVAQGIYSTVYKAELEFGDIHYHKLNSTIRVFQRIKNRGRVTAKYARPVLIFELKKYKDLVLADGAEYTWTKCTKNGKPCPIGCQFRGTTFISPDVEVVENYLPWIVPKVVASPYHIPYQHENDLPPGDIGDIAIFEIVAAFDQSSQLLETSQQVNQKRRELFVIRFYSEQGIEPYPIIQTEKAMLREPQPRVCPLVDPDRGVEIKFKIRIVSENAEPISEECILKIHKDTDSEERSLELICQRMMKQEKSTTSIKVKLPSPSAPKQGFCQILNNKCPYTNYSALITTVTYTPFQNSFIYQCNVLREVCKIYPGACHDLNKGKCPFLHN